MDIAKQKGLAIAQTLLWLLVLINTASLACYFYKQYLNVNETPNLVGVWSGENLTISDEKGYKTRPKLITITEQKDRRFRGTFTYGDGTKHFFGVIYPNNKSFTWVSTPSHGFIHGNILAEDKIGACYVEAWENASAGCATLERQSY